MTEYAVYDVFTDKPFGGNQLAVFPDATHLPEDDLQNIAKEFNFSEVTFVYPPENGDHTAKVRIFTPTMEVPFAGHPTIGTAVALADTGHGPDMVLELGVGPLACRASAGSAQFTTEVALERLASPAPELVARALGISADAILSQTHAPVMATLGLAFTITEIDCKDTLSALQTDVAAFREGAKAHPAGLDFAQFAYVREGDVVHARMFAPLDNIPEDPATGSVCATLGALLADIEGNDVTLRIHQGDDMGRSSVIGVTTLDGAVTISGQAKKVMEGRLVY
ncbi:PhzF family phenazine biosynthesis protein [Shimia thalassica]|uniref:PhzF family phenazine biosynthesis protein n=1 Tax=Shimia thalassica TaxID=1715693 RepID=UPI001C0927CD|nr:PhzF family phenazine biosynthesis protein [Shimia thalassica]MBU2941653.1 PhzF family phenazine biosynthesis protein [Shimia thalassica]MDO6503966.1 PhzF family phenazine biosynthesis protein [Shimia thalassica]